MTKQRLSYIDALKGTAILLVTIGHSFIGSNPFPPNVPYNLMNFIYAVHMPLFFFISGYVFNLDNYFNKFALFVGKKFTSLILPYIIFYILSIPIMFIISGFMPAHSVLSYLNDFKLLMPVYYGWLWFLPVLFMTEIFYYILSSITSKYKELLLPMVIGVCFFSILISEYSSLPNSQPWITAMRVSGITLIYYYLGNVMRNSMSFGNKQALFIIGICAPIFLAFGGLNLRHVNDITTVSAWIEYSSVAVCGILCIYFSVVILYEYGIKSKVLEFLGKNCIFIYLFQGYAVALVGRFNGKLYPPIIDGNHVFEIALLIMVFTIPFILVANYVIPFLLGKLHNSGK